MPTRREFLAGAFALVATACSSGTSKPGSTTGTPRSIADLTNGVPQLSLLGLGPGGTGGDPSDPIQTGTSLQTFDLGVGTGGQLLGEGVAALYAAPSESAALRGPFRAPWSPFTGYEKTGDHSPKSSIPGVYVAQATFPREGLWTVAAVGPGGASKGVGVSHVYVGEPTVAKVGSKAISVTTPVATGGRALKEICTREPPDPMHYISLDEALKNGKPTVAVFSTPLLCQSQLCGPVTDEVLLAYEKYGKDRANFIHIEEFLPGPDLKVNSSKLSPAFQAWGFRSEPWVIVIDKHGIIRSRHLGPTTSPMVDFTLKPLL
jgi:hypothetical protein